MPGRRQAASSGAAVEEPAVAEVPAPDDDDELEHGDDEHGDEPELEDEHDDDELDEPTAKVDSIEKQAREFRQLMDGFEADLRAFFGETEPLERVPMDGACGFMAPGSLVYKENDKFRRCGTCNGHGVVITGSLADGKQTADCPRCGGRGYLERLPDAPATPGEPTNGNAAHDDDDGFGVPSWMGDPSIGGQT